MLYGITDHKAIYKVGAENTPIVLADTTMLAHGTANGPWVIEPQPSHGGRIMVFDCAIAGTAGGTLRFNGRGYAKNTRDGGFSLYSQRVIEPVATRAAETDIVLADNIEFSIMAYAVIDLADNIVSALPAFVGCKISELVAWTGAGIMTIQTRVVD